MIQQVHIHPIVIPTSTTTSRPTLIPRPMIISYCAVGLSLVGDCINCVVGNRVSVVFFIDSLSAMLVLTFVSVLFTHAEQVCSPLLVQLQK